LNVSGVPLARKVMELALPALKVVAVVVLVMDAASSTVRVKIWVPLGLTPLFAVRVMG